MESGSSSSIVKKVDRTWSDLPIDILGLIVDLMPSPVDCLRFSTVCKDWRWAWAQQGPRPLAWLALTPGNNLTNFSLDGACCSRLPLPPKLHGSRFCGSFANWLVVAHPDDQGYLSLFDPFSEAEIPLPNQSTIQLQWHRVTRCINQRRLKRYFIRKAVLSSSPKSNQNCDVLVAAIHDSCQLCICRLMGRKWVSLPKEPYVDDIIFYKGLLHVLATDFKVYHVKVAATDDEITSVDMLPIQPWRDCLNLGDKIMRGYLVESRGKLMMILRLFTCKHRPIPDSDYLVEYNGTCSFQVLELESDRWVEVNSLGGHAIFVGNSGSKSVPSDQHAGVKEDCIYFTDDYCRFTVDYLNFDSGVFSMKDGSIEIIVTQPQPSTSPPQWLLFTN